MKTKLGASLIAALMMMGLFGVTAAQADPNPDGPAKKGLCTAYFNGQKKGHDKHGDPGPFQALEDAAAGEDEFDDTEAGSDGDLQQAEAVLRFCDDIIIGGNPNENGRYNCTPDNPATTDTDETNCERNTAPGGGKSKP